MLLLCTFPFRAAADTVPPTPAKNWDVTFGIAALHTPRYEGSSESKTLALPFITAHYLAAYGTWFFEMEQAGLEFYREGGLGFSAGFGVGENRKSDSFNFLFGDTSPPILLGTPVVESTLSWFIGADYAAPFADIAIKLKYTPVSWRYDDAPHGGKNFDTLSAELAVDRKKPSAEK